MNPSLLKRKDLSRISTELDSIFSIFSETRHDSEYLTISIHDGRAMTLKVIFSGSVPQMGRIK